MDARLRFLDQFRNKSEAESKWLQEIFSFIRQHIFPLVSGLTRPAADPLLTGVCCQELAIRLVKKIENMCVSHTFPVSYRLISISELVSQQHLPCVSNLSWRTSQQRAWLKEAELSLPGHQALQRVNLLLTGCLEEGQVGGWRLTDTSGSVRCECVSFSPLWLHHPVFFPHWNYIPYNASGQDQTEAGGHVELIGSPVLLCPAPEQGMDLIRAVGVSEAAGFLSSRPRGQRLAVCGHVGSVCSLLRVAGTSFFCFSLTDNTRSLPVLVKESSSLWWSECLCVGDRVCVTSLRICVSRGWKGNSILAVTDHSEIHTNYSQAPREDSCAEPQRDTPPSLVMSCINDDTAESQRNLPQTDARIKKSRIINYQGTVTEVVSAGAGLYVIDGKVGLCLAYQPPLRRELRAGDSVQISHVHFLYRPSPDFPPSILCTCLRSTLKITSFSKVFGSSAGSSCPGDGVLPRLILEKNMGICEYLWVCHLSSQLSRSLVPSMLKQCVCMLSWKLMAFVWRRERVDKERRNIYSEMLDEPHTCPVTQYSVDPACPQYVSVSELCQSLHLDCWSSVSLNSLLPDGGSSLTSSQINMMLSWSFNVQTGSRLRRRPLVLVGILELPTKTTELTLQLRDGTAAVACVATETNHGDEGRNTAFNTAWIGCLVCVLEFTVVTERFMQSDFPSFQHLDQEKYITHKSCRIYLQFSVDHVHILSPSVAMGTHLHQKGRDSAGYVSGQMDGMQEEKIGGQKKRKFEDEGSPSAPTAVMPTGSNSGWQCVSMVIRVEHKEGVSWRNAGSNEEEVGLELCFTVKAAVMGPVVTWRQKPKNRPMSEKEMKKERKVVLVFSGTSVRWFPVIQPGSFYRLVATNAQDPGVLIGSGVSAQSGVELYADSTLQVKPDWRFHTLTNSLLLPVYRRAPPTTVLSVSEVLECSCDLVCFQALVSDRIGVKHGFNDSGDKNKGVRLTVCDQRGWSLHVYLELNHTPYPLGLLPGNTLLFSDFQRRVSRAGSVYCSHLPISSITVVSLGDSSWPQPPPAPMMHLGLWAGRPGPSCIVGRVRGHVVCVLFVRLQWICSLCGGLYRQSCCSSLCRSASSVFQSKAKLVLDDGTGEAHVWVSGALVRPLLGLNDCQWEGLQRVLRVRGQVEVYPWGQNLVCDDALLHFLLCVCNSKVVCRQLSLTCRKHNRQRPEELKRFIRGDRDFLTRVNPPLQLTCLHINPH